VAEHAPIRDREGTATIASKAEQGPSASWSVVSLVGALASIYMISQLLRMSVGVIAPDLAAELSLSASQVGLLASIYFLTFALAQIPLGICIDRYGPKLCMVVCAGLTVIGIVLFSLATAASELMAARALIGLGTSGYLMAPLTIYAQRFPPERFAFFAGVQLSIGTCGTLIATAPLAYVVAAIGWRPAFLLIAVAMALAGLLVAIVVPERKPAAAAPARETLAESIKGVGEVLRIPSVAPVFVMQMANYSSFAFFVGLWGGPYLTHVYGFGLTERGTLLLIPVIAQIVGSMVWGASPGLLGSYKLPVLIGSALTGSLLAGLAWLGQPSFPLLIAWFVAFGFSAAYTPVLIAHGKSLFPPRLIGRGMTILNIGSMGGVFISQTVSGVVVGLFAGRENTYEIAAYQAAFAVQAAFVGISMLIYTKARDRSHNSTASAATL
jgi:MFS family permease